MTRLCECEVWACILIGGKSSRMGQPKHLLQAANGISWLERLVALVDPRVEKIVLSGAGEVPASLSHLHRLPDMAGVKGPLAGILSAMNYRDNVAWLLLACDMPRVSDESLQWLLNQRQPGCWGVVPRLEMNERVEPLFALYEPQSKVLFEAMRTEKLLRISTVAQDARIKAALVPPSLRDAWKNVNTPDQLSDL